MTPITKKRAFYSALLLCFAMLFFVVFFTGRDKTRLTTFRSGSGWGYAVSTQGKVVICQPFIPAIEGNKPFATKSDAKKAGKIIVTRLIEGAEPSLSKDELLRAGVRII
jgi:hypothetical protein